MGIFGSTKHDARPTHDEYGRNYSQFLLAPATAADPFPNPVNDGQRVMNARARASRAGTPINSGYLNPKTGVLEDPDRGFGRWMGNHPGVMAAGVIGGGLTAGALMGPTAATTMVAPGIPAVAGTGAGLTAPTAAGLVAPTVAGAATTMAAPGIPTVAGTGAGLVAPTAKALAPKAASFWGGISVKDLIGLGGGAVEEYLKYRAASGASEAQIAAEREALDFAKKAYEEQNAKEQARYDAREARRAPYREASLASLNELKRVIGLS